MEDELSEDELNELCSSAMILEIALRNIDAFADNPKILEELELFKIKAKEALDELTDKQMNQFLEGYKTRNEKIAKEIKEEEKENE